MYSFDRFEETALPSQDSFFSKLSGCPCSDSEYTHATRVRDAFGCETIAHCHDIYLQLDVLLLADVFKKFRKTCLDFYKLDPLHYYTTPALAWDADLRMSRVDLHLISDKDMYHFVENSIRGGISMISTRHAQANNPSFPATYNASLPRQDLIYLDANNLYGWAMLQSLPTHGFRFLSEEEISALVLKDIPDDVDVGYILELDLHYPTSLHSRHGDYPLAPESLVSDRSMYSSTTTATKVYRMLAFNQSPCLKTYIYFNTRQGTLAENCSFLKDYFTLKDNIVFGKTHENPRKRVNVELVTDFCRGKLITDCSTVVQTTLATLPLNRPIYVESTVLELSKLHMYDFQ